MRFPPISVSLAILCILIIVGCGKNHAPPISPSLEEPAQTSDRTSSVDNRQLFGIWEITISGDRLSADAAPLRGAEMHFNMVYTLENKCLNCLTIDNLQSLPDNSLSADLILKHPFPGQAAFSGFDVRGVLVTGADYAFPESNRLITWGTGDLKLLNADGYTSLFNPTEFPENPDIFNILHYWKGNLASVTDELTSTLNPFVSYAEDNPRRVFVAGTVQTETVIMKLPSGPIRFGYVVNASWSPAGKDVIDPVEDFPPEANCMEAYRIAVNSNIEFQPNSPSTVPIEVEVWDHQGPGTISTVTIESPDLFTGEVELTWSTTTVEDSAIFTGWVANELNAGGGEHPLLVRVTDVETDQNLGVVDAWYVEPVQVTSLGWARTWGGTYLDWGRDVAVDNAGNLYVVGEFYETVDFDPGNGVQEQISNGKDDIFLSSFDTSGNLRWVKTWGGTKYEDCRAVTVDGSGNIYIAGGFRDIVDFDPGPGTDEHTSTIGAFDIFLSKFDTEGNYQWVRTWGPGEGQQVAVDGSGNVYLTGRYYLTVDFDPGSGVDEHTSNGHSDIFISKFDALGNYIWARTWGSEYLNELGTGIAVEDSGNVFVTGYYQLTVDFDPGNGIENQTSNGYSDIFLSIFDSMGNFENVRCWGGESSDRSRNVEVNGAGNVFVTGNYSSTVDFNPGTEVEEYTSNGGSDIFLSSFDSSGNFAWVRTWGGNNIEDKGFGVVVDGSGFVYVTGKYDGTVDFDPGPGIENHTADAFYDAFLSKFDSSGTFQWARTWGGFGSDYGFGVDVDVTGNVFIVGSYKYTVDFNPGPGIDEHTSNGLSDVFLSKFPPDGNW